MEEQPKVTFEVKMRMNNGGIEKAIFINGEKLDYSIDISSFQDAQRMGPQFKKAVQEDIVKHFTESVSEFLGRKVTLEDIKEAIQTGWI